MNREQIKQVLEVLKSSTLHPDSELNEFDYKDAINILQAALAEPSTHRATGWVAPVDRYAVPVLFNPYTGEPRDVRDVSSDPQGILIVPPGRVEMLAAKPALAEPSEPVCWVPPEREGEYHSSDFVNASRVPLAGWVPLFTHPEPSKPEPYNPIGAWNKGFEEGKRLSKPAPLPELTDAEVDSIVFQHMDELNLPEGNPARRLNAYRSLVRTGAAAREKAK